MTLVAAVSGLAALVWSCVARARRLDRLHIRLDAAQAGLETALDRRAEVALLISALGSGSPGLCAAARAAATANAEREVSENALTRELAGVDRSALDAEVHEELVDAEQLVILARRVHNDAVRDTLGLRSRRLVRWLRLAGTAPLPVYFEIADPEPGPSAGVPQSPAASP